MSLGEGVYRLGLRILKGASSALVVGDSKVARGLRGRRHTVASATAWAETGRVPDRPLVWFHAPSVGEGLQAMAVAEALTSSMDGIQTAFTYFSPSAAALGTRFPSDWSGYLPWDVPSELNRFFAVLRPTVLVFTKTEVWPGASRVAATSGVPTTLIAATLPPGAGRLRAPARTLLRPSFRRLAAVGVVSRDDAQRFSRLGVPPHRLRITGDPGVDSAWRRVQEIDRASPFLKPFLTDRFPTIVAGSTWEPDERVLIQACSEARQRVPELRLVIVPHEPNHGRVARLGRHLAWAGWNPARLAEVESSGRAEPGAAVIVDRVGVLAQLYAAGEIAYVGGGFHGRGLHSVLEPAAAGLPVTFGPRHGNAPAATALLACGGARQVDSSAELSGLIESWFDDPVPRGEAARAALRYVEGHRGAAERSARIVLDLIDRGGS